MKLKNIVLLQVLALVVWGTVLLICAKCHPEKTKLDKAQEQKMLHDYEQMKKERFRE